MQKVHAISAVDHKEQTKRKNRKNHHEYSRNDQSGSEKLLWRAQLVPIDEIAFPHVNEAPGNTGEGGKDHDYPENGGIMAPVHLAHAEIGDENGREDVNKDAGYSIFTFPLFFQKKFHCFRNCPHNKKIVLLRKSNINICMLSKIEHLSESEKQLILDAPIMVSALVAGSDGEFKSEEIAQAVKIIHIKTYSETRDVSGVYKTIDGHTEASIDEFIHKLPESTFDRNKTLEEKLSRLNNIFPKLDPQFAHDLYKSLKELAFYVSTAGDLGVGMRSEQEKETAKLAFINEPVY